MTLHLFFLRHGQTPHSKADTFCGLGSNPQLTEDGSEMAKQFAEAYRNFKWQGIYCSTLQRAQLTAQPLLDFLGVKAEFRDGLREIDYGKWESKTPAEVSVTFSDDHKAWLEDPEQSAPTGGETAAAIAKRAMQVVDEIRSLHTDGNVLIISHKATIRITLCALLGIDLSLFRYRLACPVASLSEVEFTKNGPILLRLADRSHLNERLRDLPGT